MKDFRISKQKYIFVCIIFVLTLLIITIIKIIEASKYGSVNIASLNSSIQALPTIIQPNLKSHFSWGYLTSTSLSGSAHSQTMVSTITILSVVFIFFSIYFIFKKKINFKKFDYISLSFAIIFSAINTMNFLKDLPDEAYVWATKIVNFSKTGKLGVELFDGVYGESTVGTFQFLVSSILFKFFSLSVEQSLILPIFVSLLLIVVISYVSLRKVWSSSLVPAIFVLTLIFSSKLILNVVSAFDNVMALLILIVWITSELKLLKFCQLRNIRLVIFVIAPLIRIDLFVLSFIVIWLSYQDLETLKYNKKSFLIKLIAFRRENLVIFISFLTWIIYKFWAFNEMFPAMLKYKSPSFDLAYILAGTKYSILSVGKQVSVLIIIALTILLLTTVRKKRLPSNFILGFLILVVSQLVSSVMSGGDYFGPLLARYLLISLASSLFISLIYLGKYGKKSIEKVQKNTMIGFSILLCISLVGNPVYFNPSLDRFPFKSNPIGRVSCENMALISIKNYFLSLGRSDIKLVTAEVNSAAFYLDAKLIDTIGLVDSRLYPMKPRPYSSGAVLRKFQITPTDTVLQGSDIIWFHGAAVCEDYDTYNLISSDSSESDAQKFMRLFNTHQIRYRYDINKLLDLGFVATHMEFTYSLSRSSQTRKGEIFTLIRKSV